MKPKTGAVIVAIMAWLNIMAFVWYMTIVDKVNPIGPFITFAIIALIASAVASEGKQE